MMAMAYNYQNAIHASSSRHPFMPFFAKKMNACMPGAANANFIHKTDVITSVSLFMLAVYIIGITITEIIGVVSLLLVGLVVGLISLLLIGLTGLIWLISLVGLIEEPDARHAQGD